MTPQVHRTWWVVAMILTGTTGTGFAQQTPSRDGARPPTKGTASLMGTVVADDEAHRPMPHVVLTLSTAGLNGNLTTATDEAGHYRLADLPAGVYTLTAARGAYLTASYGALGQGAPPVPIPLKDGQQFVADPIVLVKGSVIAGRLTDADGRPVAGARVMALSFVTVGGERRPGPVQYGRGDATTDSRGLYRIYGLAAGDYLVFTVASMYATPGIVMTSPEEVQWAEARTGARMAPVGPPPPHPRPFAWAPTYFPGVVDPAGAAVVSLGRADERQDVDVSLLRVGIARLTGMVYGLDGQPAADAMVLRSQKHVSNALGLSAFSGPVRSSKDGSFAFTGLPPGQYTITVRASTAGTTTVGPANLSVPAGPLTLWGQADVSVSGDDLDGVAIHLQPGTTVSGSMVFEGSTPPPEDLARFKPHLVPVDSDVPNVTVDVGGAPAKVDRTFALEGVMPGSYVLTGAGNVPTTAGSGPGWTLKSVVTGGRDLLNAPFEVHPREDFSGAVVTYSDRHTALDGQLTNAAGQPVSQFRVLVFSSNHDRWAPTVLPRWMASVRAGVDGSFRIVGLPPGEYYVCALVEAAQPPTADEAFLTSLVPASIKIVLADGETHTQTFKVGG
jgi:hypothetical protein